MKIAYLINYPIGKEDGVIKKVKTQISEWEKLGHDVKVYALFSNEKNPSINAKQYPYHNVFSRKFSLCNLLMLDLSDFDPDIVYFRYTYWNRTLSKIQKIYTNIVEINTDDIAETKSKFIYRKNLYNFIRMVLNRILRIPVLKKANAIITVTFELANNNSIKKYSVPIMTIPNSYNLNIDLARKEISKLSNKIELFFIGSPDQVWHGIDIIENIAKKIPEFHFHIIGYNGMTHDNVYYHGYLQEKEYFHILEKCCVCIGTLALFRKNMNEACPLKVREYLARGYPIIIGYKDTAFFNKKLPEWVLEIDLKNNTLNELEIIDFVKNNKNRVIEKQEVEPYISSSAIEKRRVKFFEEVVQENIDRKKIDKKKRTAKLS